MDGLSNRAQLSRIRDHRRHAAQQNLDILPDVQNTDAALPSPSSSSSEQPSTDTPTLPSAQSSQQPDFTDELRKLRLMENKPEGADHDKEE